MTERADISIIGCGWLGLPLAERLVKTGKRVKGSTTSHEKLAVLEEKGIIPYRINLQDESLDRRLLADFLYTDVLLINIPARIKPGEQNNYLSQMKVLLMAMLESTVSKVLFISSTSVYLNLNRTVTEEDSVLTEEKEPGNTMLAAENIYRNREDWVTTIIRFGGLVGGNRQAGRFMAGKQELPDGEAPVNLIHLDDCVNILQQVIEQEKWGKIYNACADAHPTRQQFYTAAAEALGLIPPTFSEMQGTAFKLIKSDKLKQDLSYVFLHPDPMAFF